MNEVLGRPFHGWELRRIMGYHSCEESPMTEGCLLPAFETGIGAMVGINGGWVVASDDLVMVQRAPLPDTKVLVFIPEVKSLEDEFQGKETSAESEVELLLRRARTLDNMQTGAKARLVLFDMIPAMIRGDLKGIGDALFDISYLGSKRAECEQHGAYGTPIYSFINAFREMGIEIAGMSSVGPTIFALTQKEDAYRRARSYLDSLGISETRIIETEVDNMGGTITEDGVERTFHQRYLAEGLNHGKRLQGKDLRHDQRRRRQARRRPRGRFFSGSWWRSGFPPRSLSIDEAVPLFRSPPVPGVALVFEMAPDRVRARHGEIEALRRSVPGADGPFLVERTETGKAVRPALAVHPFAGVGSAGGGGRFRP